MLGVVSVESLFKLKSRELLVPFTHPFFFFLFFLSVIYHAARVVVDAFRVVRSCTTLRFIWYVFSPYLLLLGDRGERKRERASEKVLNWRTFVEKEGGDTPQSNEQHTTDAHIHTYTHTHASTLLFQIPTNTPLRPAFFSLFIYTKRLVSLSACVF